MPKQSRDGLCTRTKSWVLFIFSISLFKHCFSGNKDTCESETRLPRNLRIGTQSAFLSLGCWDWPATVVTSLPLVSQCTSGRSRRKHCSSRSSDANLFIGKQKQIWFETPDDHQSHTIVMVSRTLSASRSDDKCCKCQNKSHFKASDANVRLTTTD